MRLGDIHKNWHFKHFMLKYNASVRGYKYIRATLGVKSYTSYKTRSH
jgi:hypothetical protein